MKLIQENPFRIAGVLVNATEREIIKQKSKLSKMASIGRQVDSELDFSFLNKVNRAELKLINKAFSEIEHNHDKLRHSLFWLIKVNIFDELAINYLKNGDLGKAIEILDKVTNGKEVTSKNFSSFNNISTLKLYSNYNAEIKEALELKLKLIESKNFSEFVHLVADHTLLINNQKQTEIFIDDILTQLKNNYSILEILNLFNNCSGLVQKYISKRFSEEPYRNIENQIENCKKKRKVNKKNAYEYGLKLYTETKTDLSLLKSLIAKDELQYKAIADQLANEIMQCGIDYFNESQENDSSEDFLKQAQELNETALSIAVGKLTRDRAKDSLDTLEEMKDRDVAQAIALLQSVKDAYETNEQQIRQQVKELKESDPLIRLGHRTINQSAVEDNIRNSIDWGKVNELLKEVLPKESLERIKASTNNELKSEFTELAYWLKDYSQSNSLISRIIDQYKRIPPKLSFKIVSSEITNTDNQPLYTKFIRYIGLNLNLDVANDTTVTFYLKYITPSGSLKRNSKSSPKGYSQSVTKTISKRTSKVILPGWGNSEECTYDIGEHRIEVYVDEFLIHTKKYTVDLAPSEKLEKEIASAEKKLREINQTDYYEAEIRSAKNEISKIQKFNLFRASSKKQGQIQAQQAKIDKLIQRSKEEKKKDVQTQEEKIYKLKMKLSAAKY